MNLPLPLLAAIVTALLVAGYFVYGRFIARRFSLDDTRRTPAHELADGEDFVPTPRSYLFGQHFSAIAAAGPIVGPILACRQFGWLPCILWIVLGVIFVGAVHDFTALVASVRHRARSVAEIVREHIGPRAWAAMLVFIWIALIYVILAFTDVTASTFVGVDQELREGLGTVRFNGGGAVAAAATMYLLLAVLMGVVQRLWKPPLWAVTAVFVPATGVAIWGATKISTLLLFSQTTWGVVILAYCCVASLLPVWMLLQPRGHLGGFVLYAVLAVGVFGVFFGGYEVRAPATTDAPLFGMEGSIFPFLFVTIACGACSGFHGLVCSGTTSKQIDRESHCRSVGYGAMLLEGLVALVALATVMILTPEESKAGGAAGTVYGNGIASFLAKIIGEEHIAVARTFGAMAFSTFVFDTLDVAARLGRYVLQELTGKSGRTSAIVATLLTAGVPLALYLASGPGAYLTFWTLFGTSNQLLAGLTLLGISVWLRKSGKPSWFTVVPMVFVLSITVWSLAAQVLGFWTKARAPGAVNAAALYANCSVGVVLVVLAGFFAWESTRTLIRKPVAA